MRESIIYSTENGNLYLYDMQHMLQMLIHPEFGKADKNELDADPYYLKKYNYLKRYGFFKPKLAEFDITIKESIIEDKLKQINEIVFETTDYCNLKCQYCSLGELYDGFNKKDPRNINLEHAMKLLEYVFYIKSPKSKLIIGFFGGEPLINISFIKKIVQFAKQINSDKGLVIAYKMVTNATLLEKHIRFLVENDFSLLVSLDGNEYGHSYRTFDKSDKNSFKKVIANLDMIQNNYSEYFINKINFNSVLHNRNSVKDIYEFIYNRYNKLPRIAELNAGFINPDKKELHENMFHDKSESEKEFQNNNSDSIPIGLNNSTLYSELKKFLQYDSVNFYVSNLLHLSQDKIKTLPSNTCMPFTKNIFLNTQSYIYPCENIKNKYFLGKVDDENIIINIPEIVQKYKFYFEHLKNICKDCYSINSCSICMYNIVNLDKLPKKKLECPEFQDKKAYIKKMHRIFSFVEKHPDYITHIL